MPTDRMMILEINDVWYLFHRDEEGQMTITTSSHPEDTRRTVPQTFKGVFEMCTGESDFWSSVHVILWEDDA